jgi:hypothetical protein
MSLRQEVWQRLASDLRPRCLEKIRRVVPFGALQESFGAYLDGRVVGRTVVAIAVD